MTWSFTADSPAVGSAGSACPPAEASSARESTLPGRDMRASRTSNSVLVSPTGTPPRDSSREAGSSTTSRHARAASAGAGRAEERLSSARARSSTTGSEKGLDTKSSASRWKARSWSSSPSRAVMTMTGTSEEDLIASQRVKPSILGIITSSMTRSKGTLRRASWNARSPASPSLSPRTSKPALASSWTSASSTSGSSSTTSTCFAIDAPLPASPSATVGPIR